MPISNLLRSHTSEADRLAHEKPEAFILGGLDEVSKLHRLGRVAEATGLEGALETAFCRLTGFIPKPSKTS